MIDYLIHDETGNIVLMALINGVAAIFLFPKLFQGMKMRVDNKIIAVISASIFAIIGGQLIYWFIAIPLLLMIFGL